MEITFEEICSIAKLTHIFLLRNQKTASLAILWIGSPAYGTTLEPV
jgi:hypothetical protein